MCSLHLGREGRSVQVCGQSGPGGVRASICRAPATEGSVPARTPSPTAGPPCRNHARGWLPGGRAETQGGKRTEKAGPTPVTSPSLSCSYVWAGSPADVRAPLPFHSTRHPRADFRGRVSCVETCWWRQRLQIRRQRSKCDKRLCLKILFKLLRTDMQTAYFLMNNSILLTELFSYFPISQSWKTRTAKRRLFCIEFLTPSWPRLVLAMCWEKLCECTVWLS